MNTEKLKIKNILLIEDNAADALLVREALSQSELQFELEIIKDGEAALSRIVNLETDSTHKRPHLIIIDLNLPRRDGKDVLRQLQASNLCKVIPVVVLSSSALPQDEADSLRLGAQRYFRKSIDLDESMKIGQMIKEILTDKS